MKDNFDKQLLMNIDEGIYFVDVDRKISFWNKAAEKNFGYSALEVIGSC